MSIKYVGHHHWGNTSTSDHMEYEYADTGISRFMSPTEWIRKNFTPLSTYAVPNINTLAEIAKYKLEHANG